MISCCSLGIWVVLVTCTTEQSECLKSTHSKNKRSQKMKLHFVVDKSDVSCKLIRKTWWCSWYVLCDKALFWVADLLMNKMCFPFLVIFWMAVLLIMMNKICFPFLVMFRMAVLFLDKCDFYLLSVNMVFFIFS